MHKPTDMTKVTQLTTSMVKPQKCMNPVTSTMVKVTQVKTSKDKWRQLKTSKDKWRQLKTSKDKWRQDLFSNGYYFPASPASPTILPITPGDPNNIPRISTRPLHLHPVSDYSSANLPLCIPRHKTYPWQHVSSTVTRGIPSNHSFFTHCLWMLVACQMC